MQKIPFSCESNKKRESFRISVELRPFDQICHLFAKKSLHKIKLRLHERSFLFWFQDNETRVVSLKKIKDYEEKTFKNQYGSK